MGHPDLSLKIRLSPAGRTRQPGSQCAQTNRMDYHQLPIPHIDHIAYIKRYAINKYYWIKYVLLYQMAEFLNVPINFWLL